MSRTACADAPVVVFVHVHYGEVWPSIVERLTDRLLVPFRLIATATTEAALTSPDSPWLREFKIIRVENRGRDVLPFQIALRAAGPFEIGLKLHSKRSVHRINGDAWREAILSSLLPDEESRLPALLQRMRQDPRIGFVAPDRAFCNLGHLVGANQDGMDTLAGRLGHSAGELTEKSPFFAPGTMFWFRRDALKRFEMADIEDLFLEEGGETDGTAAHAMERLFAPLAAAAEAVPMPFEAALSTEHSDDTSSLRDQAARHATDSEFFVHVPGRIGEWVMRFAPFLIPIYRRAPKRMRSALKYVLGASRRWRGQSRPGSAAEKLPGA